MKMVKGSKGVMGKEKRALIIRRVALGVLLLALLYLIFGASSQDAEQSGSISAWATEVANAFLAMMGLSLRFSEYFVRKCAHFTEYAILGVLLLLNILEWVGVVFKETSANERVLKALTFFSTLLFGLMIPVFDEYFQTFVPGRAGLVSDVLIDFAGVCVGVAVCGVMQRFIKKKVKV